MSGEVLTSDELRQAARDFLANEAPSARVREVADAGGAPDERAATEAAGMGWFGLEIPESLGGGGASFAELALLVEETGARAASLPLVSSAVLCAGALLIDGSDAQRQRWLPAIADGSIRGTALLPGSFERTAALTVQPDGASLLLDGRCRHVLDARVSELLIVFAGSDADDSGPVVAAVESGMPGVVIEPLSMVDKTRGFGSVRFDGVRVPAENVLVCGHDALLLRDALVNRVAVAIAADSLGITRRVLEMTVAYTCQRRQFDRPIGSFQAVKHQAADLFVDLQTSGVLVADAARSVSRDAAATDAAETASMAKSHTCEKAARGAGVAVQLHGGIGYTWEHDLHLFLKRAKLNEQLAGDARWHRRRIATQVLNART